MQHPDPDDLALIALGEDRGEAIADHVDNCAICQEEIAAFATTVGLAELANYGEDAPPPGEHVWLAIANELGFTGATSTVTMKDTAAPDSPAASNSAAAGRPELNGGGPVLRSVPDNGADVTDPALTAPQPRRRRSRWVAPLAAIVVGVAIGAGAVIVAQNRSSDETIEAVAPLTPVDTGPLAADAGRQLGEAELVAVPAGNQVRVNAADLPATGNSYEVWLFGDEGNMVSLGTLSDGAGTFTVPNGIDPRVYRVVDVSEEPPDGKPAHSGVSLVRGAFS